MNAPDRIWAWTEPDPYAPHWAVEKFWISNPSMVTGEETEYLRADGPTITAYREALRTLGVDPDSIALEAQKEASNG